LGQAEAYRRGSLLEGVGAWLSRRVPDGAARRWLRGAYRAAMHLASGGRGIPAVLPGGETVRLLPEYRYVTWNSAEYEAFRAAVRPGDVALDVGANAGAYALALGHRVRPGGRVFAFEPAPDTFRGLAAHVRLNGLEDVVVPVRAAAAGFTGRATLSVDGISGENRLDDAAGGEPVEAITLDDFCAREGISPTFIKIDVEGAELDVLRGARETIRAGGAGLALFVEMHPAVWPGLGIGRAELEAELALQGLRAEPLRPVADAWALEGECLRLVPLDTHAPPR
jgi:FkbM family methyltransferase